MNLYALVLFVFTVVTFVSCAKKETQSTVNLKAPSTSMSEHYLELDIDKVEFEKQSINELAKELSLELFEVSKVYFYNVDLNNYSSFQFHVKTPIREMELVDTIEKSLKRLDSYNTTNLSKIEKIDLEMLREYLVDQKKLKEVQISEGRIDIKHNLMVPFYMLYAIKDIKDINRRSILAKNFIETLAKTKYFERFWTKLMEINSEKEIAMSSSVESKLGALGFEVKELTSDFRNFANSFFSDSILVEEVVIDFKNTLTKLNSFMFDRILVAAKNKISKDEYQALLRRHGIYENADIMYEEAKTKLAIESKKMDTLIKSVKKELKLDDLSKQELFKFFRERRSANTNEELKKLVDKANEDISFIIDDQKIITQPRSPSLVLFAGLEVGEFGDILKRRSARGIPQMINSLAPFMTAPFALWSDIEVMKRKTADFIIKDSLHATTAHEGRPGHEMQFRSIKDIEKKSFIRHSMMQNTANTEGWALFAESLIEKHVSSASEKLFYKQAYMMRILRVVTDYEVNRGFITKKEAIKKYQNILGVDKSTAESEIKRRVTMPGRDTGYYVGRISIEKLRQRLITKYPAFEDKCFNDLILSYSFAPTKYVEKIIDQTDNCLK